jgi:hypothetical protein
VGFYNNAFAETNLQDGNTYLKYCKSSLKALEGGQLNEEEMIQSGNCVGFITGYINAHKLETHGTIAQEYYCLPSNGRLGEYIRKFVKYMEEHPEKLNEDTQLLFFSSLTKAFPCN